MFLEFYGLREQPFGVTPDPRFLYMSAQHREALATLVYGLEARRGFLALIARPGMGKTTLLFQLLEQLKGAARTAFLFHTRCDAEELMYQLMYELEIATSDRDMTLLREQLKEALVREARANRQVVVVIDEAQNLDDSVLESVRLLSDFETPRAKLLQFVLSGQPQLEQKLARPELSQFRQRVSVIARLAAFTRDDVQRYIEHRLAVAGCNEVLFTPGAYCQIAKLSGGIPRNISNLCFHALSIGYAAGRKIVGRDIVEEVTHDLALNSVDPDSSSLSDPERRGWPGLEGAPTEPATTESAAESAHPEPSIPMEVTREQEMVRGVLRHFATSVPAAASSSKRGPAAESDAQPPDRAVQYSTPAHRYSTAASPAVVSPRPRAERCATQRVVRRKQPSIGGGKPFHLHTFPVWPLATAVFAAGLLALGIYLTGTHSPAPAANTAAHVTTVQAPSNRSPETGTAAAGSSSHSVDDVSIPPKPRHKATQHKAGSTQHKAGSPTNARQPRSSPAAAAAEDHYERIAAPAAIPAMVRTPSALNQAGTLDEVTPPSSVRIAGNTDQGVRTLVPITTAAWNAPPNPNPSALGSKPTRILSMVQPQYPALASAAHITGDVELEAAITPDGRVDRLRTVRGNPTLARAAIDAVRRWKYAPYELNADGQELTTRIVIRFSSPD